MVSTSDFDSGSLSSNLKGNAKILKYKNMKQLLILLSFLFLSCSKTPCKPKQDKPRDVVLNDIKVLPYMLEDKRLLTNYTTVYEQGQEFMKIFISVEGFNKFIYIPAKNVSYNFCEDLYIEPSLSVFIPEGYYNTIPSFFTDSNNYIYCYTCVYTINCTRGFFYNL